MSVLEFLRNYKDAFTSVGAIAGLAIIAFGAYQYWRAERWKRMEYLANLYSRFLGDAGAYRAIWMLDGDTREIYFHEGDKQKSYRVDFNLTCDALRDYDPKREFTALDLHIRDSFDMFFFYIGQFELAIENGLVRENDVRPYLSYWIELLNKKSEDSESEKLRNCVLQYIDYVDFFTVRKILARW